MEWLHDVTRHVASSCGQDPAALALTPADVSEILDLARIASHASGERINAPLLCYVLGMARARGAVLGDIGRAVREAAGEE